MSAVTLPKFRAKKYHRRSFWACDECKLRKKKCDGVQPCATCTLHSKDCTYDSKTRPSQPPTHRIRELEDDVRAVRSLLSRVRESLTGEHLADVDSMLLKLKPAADEPSQISSPTATERSSNEGLQSMFSGRGCHLSHGSGSLHHGAYSGPAVILSVLEFFQPAEGHALVPEVLAMFDAAYSSQPEVSALPSFPSDLPEKSTSFELLNIVLMQSHPFLQFLDPRALHTLFDGIFDGSTGQQRFDDHVSASFCHMLIALGFLMSVTHHHRHSCDWALAKATDHFTTGCRLMDLWSHDDITRLQTLLVASVFLIFLSRISAAYTSISLAAASAVKQGLLADGDPISTTSPTHSFSHHRTIVTMINIDLYLSTVLGLPQAVGVDMAGKRLDAISKKFGTSFSASLDTPDDCNITSSRVEHLERSLYIVHLTASVLRSFDDSVVPSINNTHNGGIDESILRSAVRDLTNLSRDLGASFSPNAHSIDEAFSASSNVARVESEIAICWSQLSIHLPFLHYLRPLADGQPIPEAASRSALTCLKIAVNVIVRCDALLQSLTDSETYSQMVHPSNWTCIYTVFLAVVALIFLISIHKGTSKPSEAWLRANTGIRILAALRCRDGGAARCLVVIKKLVYQLNYTVDFDFESIEKTTRRVCESKTKLPTLSNILGTSPQQKNYSPRDQDSRKQSGPAAAVLEPHSLSSADKMLAHAQGLKVKDDSVRREGEVEE